MLIERYKEISGHIIYRLLKGVTQDNSDLLIGYFEKLSVREGNVLINVEKIDRVVNSSMLASFIQIKNVIDKKTGKYYGNVSLINVNNDIARVMQVTRLDAVIPVFKNFKDFLSDGRIKSRFSECKSEKQVIVDLENEVLQLKKGLIAIMGHLENKNRYIDDLNKNLETQIEERTRELKISSEIISKMNEELERKIEERTRKLEETQAQLVQSGKMAAIGQFAAGIAHEIRNPLTAITMNTAFLLDEFKDNDKVMKKLKTIEKQADRSSQIVKSLLAFSKPSKGVGRLVDINHLTDETLVLFQHQMSLGNVELIREFDSNLPKINIDPGEMSQVFLNLITNAVDAMTQGGKLFIKTHTERVTEKGRRVTDVFKVGRDIVCIEFKDTGKGISKEGLEKLFSPFHTTKEPGKGVGLGLFVSLGIAEKHQGEISVKSEVGKGTTFTVKLPVGEVSEQ